MYLFVCDVILWRKDYFMTVQNEIKWTWTTAWHTDQNTLQHTATHCNTLQHTATHCNTLSPIKMAQSSLSETSFYDEKNVLWQSKIKHTKHEILYFLFFTSFSLNTVFNIIFYIKLRVGISIRISWRIGYGVATISRLLIIIGLFCKRAL